MVPMEGFAEGPDWSEQWATVRFTDSYDSDPEYEFCPDTQEEQCRTMLIWDDDDDDDDDHDNCAVVVQGSHQFGRNRDGSNCQRSTCEGRRFDTRYPFQAETRVSGKSSSKMNRHSSGNDSAMRRGIELSGRSFQALRKTKSCLTGGVNVEQQRQHLMLVQRLSESLRPRSINAQHVATELATDNPFTCEICFADSRLLPRSCCSFPVCKSCFTKYLTTKIDEGDISPKCINFDCGKEVPAAEINRTIDGATASKLAGLLAAKKRSESVQSCPKCKTITVVSENILKRQSSTKQDLHIICPVCGQVWVYSHPSTDSSKRNSDPKDEAKFERWTRKSTYNRRNARRCPQCKVFIQKNGGCDHITCTRCSSNFCYACGQKVQNVYRDHICLKPAAVVAPVSAFVLKLKNLLRCNRE